MRGKTDNNRCRWCRVRCVLTRVEDEFRQDVDNVQWRQFVSTRLQTHTKRQARQQPKQMQVSRYWYQKKTITHSFYLWVSNIFNWFTLYTMVHSILLVKLSDLTVLFFQTLSRFSLAYRYIFESCTLHFIIHAIKDDNSNNYLPTTTYTGYKNTLINVLIYCALSAV